MTTMATADNVEEWIAAYGPEAAEIRRRLVAWLDQAAEIVPGDRPELAVASLAEMAAMIAVAYPDDRERLAQILYLAADTVATGGMRADG